MYIIYWLLYLYLNFHCVRRWAVCAFVQVVVCKVNNGVEQESVTCSMCRRSRQPQTKTHCYYIFNSYATLFFFLFRLLVIFMRYIFFRKKKLCGLFNGWNPTAASVFAIGRVLSSKYFLNGSRVASEIDLNNACDR